MAQLRAGADGLVDKPLGFGYRVNQFEAAERGKAAMAAE